MMNPNNKDNNNQCNNPQDNNIFQPQDSTHSEFDSNPGLKCIEFWTDIDKELQAYSMHSSGIKFLMDKYEDLFKQANLQLKFVDFRTDLACCIDVSDELKNKILELIN